MPAGEPEHALGQQILQRVPHFPRLPIIDEASGKAIDQSVARFRRLEQDRSAIRARVWLIERRDERFVEEVWEENSLWYGVGVQRNASVVAKSVCGYSFLRRGGDCVSTEIGPFMNYSG
jgi:hypothetical protein